MRNRHGKENRLFDLSAAEERLFNKAPWTTIPENHRGTEKLRLYLSSFLSHRIRNTFPQIQNRIQYLLNKAQADRRAIGDPRRSPKDHQQFLREIIRNYESLANKSIRRPWLLESEGMRVRGKVKALNHKFSREMHDNGHVYPFENLELDCSPEPDEQQNSRESSIVLFSEIRSQLDLFQSTQLPGLVNPEIVPVLFRKQTEQWQRLANDHLLQVAVKVAEASKEILSSVCPSSPRENSALYRQLYEALNTRFDNALRNAREDLESYCAKERFHQLQTTDTRFYTKLKAMRIVRWQRSLDAVRRKLGDQLQIDDAVALYEHLHPSADNNVICEIHDILKVYYEVFPAPPISLIFFGQC